MSIIYNENIEPSEMPADIIEPILLRCIEKVSFNVLLLTIQQQQIKPQISSSDLKKYLFYLIGYNIISYNGQKQMFTIKDEGVGLLHMIEKEKKIENTDIKDIFITFEYIE